MRVLCLWSNCKERESSAKGRREKRGWEYSAFSFLPVNIDAVQIEEERRERQ